MKENLKNGEMHHIHEQGYLALLKCQFIKCFPLSHRKTKDIFETMPPHLCACTHSTGQPPEGPTILDGLLSVPIMPMRLGLQ